MQVESRAHASGRSVSVGANYDGFYCEDRSKASQVSQTDLKLKI